MSVNKSVQTRAHKQVIHKMLRTISTINKTKYLLIGWKFTWTWIKNVSTGLCLCFSCFVVFVLNVIWVRDVMWKLISNENKCLLMSATMGFVRCQCYSLGRLNVYLFFFSIKMWKSIRGTMKTSSNWNFAQTIKRMWSILK